MLTSENSHQQSSIKVQLDRLENAGLNLSTESATHLNKLREDILGAVRQLMERNENLEESVNTTAESKEGVWEVRDSLKTLSSMMSAVPRENSILQNLFFPSMNLREETIASAEEGTFKWIFEEEDNPHHGKHSGTDHSDNSSDEEDASSVRALPNPEDEEENNKRGRSIDGSPPD